MIPTIFKVSLLLSGVAPVLASPVPATIVARAAAVDELVGYGAGATGGGSGAGTTVTSCSTFSSAVAKGGVIKVSGTLSNCGIVDVPSDTSIIGVGASSGFAGSGLRLKKVSNVIIRNLNFNLAPAKKDIIELEASSKVWIDHNSFKSKGLVGSKDDYDGLLDLKHGSDMVTVSWNKFSDHWKGSLIGHSDSNAAKDTGFLHVTYHHNNWNNVNSREPSIRFGTGHIYSSCYTDVATSAVHSRMGAQVLVESNSFNNVKLAIVTNVDSEEDGFAVEKNNLYNNSKNSISQVGTLTSVPYKYTVDAAADVCAIVAKSAGPGVVA